ncbi:MAG: OmpH family outer membrane protein [Ferruginibacter sp.]
MKHVKKVFTFLALLSVMQVAGQTKIAYIRIDDIVGLMPELAPEKLNMDTLGASYIRDSVMPGINLKQSQYNEKLAAYSDTTKKYTATARKLLLDEITALQGDLAGADQYIQQVQQARQQLFLRPFYVKAKDAIAAVAKEKGYTHVANTDIFLVAPEADDISIAVLQKLKIPVPVNNASPAAKPRTN